MKMFNSLSTWLPLVIGFITAIIALTGVLMAIFSLGVSIVIVNQSQKQFEENTKASREMFEAQQGQAATLHDSLVGQIEVLQKITNQQLEASELQLQVQKDLINEMLVSDLPKMVIDNFHVGVYPSNKQVKLNLQLFQKNIGNRTAYKFGLQTFLVFGDFSTVLAKRVNPLDMEPGATARVTFEYEFPKEYEKNFYICHVSTYYDERLKKYMKDYTYYKFDPEKHRLIDRASEGEAIRKVVDLHVK